MDPCWVDDGSWTDEKHLHFLDFLEESFLHAVFGDYGRFAGVRLDRELPDSCESTGDSGFRSRKKKKTHLYKETTGTGIMKKSTKSIRSITSRRHFNASNDQVVPQLEKRSGEEKDHRRRSHHHHQRQQTNGPN